MPKNRIENLADGVFAIVMTILILELKVPALGELNFDGQVWQQLAKLGYILVIYFVCFTVLGGYWLSHHFLISVFAKNADRLLAYFNLLFLALVSLIPFSAHFLGTYPNSQLPIMIFGINVISTGLSLMLIRWHVYKSRSIENQEITEHEFKSNLLHLSLPPLFAVIGMCFAFLSPQGSLIFFIIPAIINIIPGSLTNISKFFGIYNKQAAKTATTGISEQHPGTMV